MKIDKRVEYVFGDSVEISSEISSKTTFQRGCRNGPSYDLQAMAILVKAAASVMVDTAVEELEHEIVDW
jgi:hypothetical protein